MRFLWPLLFILIGTSPLTTRSYAKPDIQISANTDSVSLEETITLKINAQWQVDLANYRFGFPPLPLENLELVRQGESQETLFLEGEKWLRKTFRFELKGIEEGPATINTFSVLYTDSGTNESGKKTIPTTHFSILSPPKASNPILLIFFITFPILLIGSFLLIKIKAQQVRAEQETSGDTNDVEIIEALTFENAHQDVQELSKLFFNFLENHYELDGSQLTDSEITNQLQNKNLLHEDQETIKELLTSIHEAKFMGTQASKSELNLMRNKIAYFIKGKQSTEIPAIHT